MNSRRFPVDHLRVEENLGTSVSLRIDFDNLSVRELIINIFRRIFAGFQFCFIIQGDVTVFLFNILSCIMAIMAVVNSDFIQELLHMLIKIPTPKAYLLIAIRRLESLVKWRRQSQGLSNIQHNSRTAACRQNGKICWRGQAKSRHIQLFEHYLNRLLSVILMSPRVLSKQTGSFTRIQFDLREGILLNSGKIFPILNSSMLAEGLDMESFLSQFGLSTDDIIFVPQFSPKIVLLGNTDECGEAFQRSIVSSQTNFTLSRANVHNHTRRILIHSKIF